MPDDSLSCDNFAIVFLRRFLESKVGIVTGAGLFRTPAATC